MTDKQLIELYWARSEDAIKQTERRYGRFCHALAYRILRSDEDAEECVNDTIDTNKNTRAASLGLPLGSLSL
jgi:RNA polymerase sigma-70 factor (ECF subfamily)